MQKHQFMTKQRNILMQFFFSSTGLLESPVMPLHVTVDTVHYKIFISGKSGVGKTAFVARLAGLNIPNVHHETTGGFRTKHWSFSKGRRSYRCSYSVFDVEGIQTTVVYWPVKLRESGKVLFFRLQFWDCGENALRRFDHLLPVRIILSWNSVWTFK